MSVSLRAALPPVYLSAGLRLAFPVLVLPVMALRLGADEFGRLSLFLVWAGLLGVLVEGGFLAAATRLAVRADAAGRWALAQKVFAARCVLSGVALIVAVSVVASHERGTPWAERIAHMGLLAGLAFATGWTATWYLQATAQLHRWARVEVVVHLTWLAAVLLLAHSATIYLLLNLLATGTLALLGWRWLQSDLSAAHPAPGGGRLPLWSAPAIKPGLRLGWTMMPVSLSGAAFSVALPAIAAAHLSRSDLGVYYLADRLVRTLLHGADPVFQIVYPRIVSHFGQGARAAWAYTARWALLGAAAGFGLLVAGALVWPWLAGWFAPDTGGVDATQLRAVIAVLGWLLPLLLGWKFFGYWVLGSGRFDHAYRLSMVAAGVFGVLAALRLADGGPVMLAYVALGSELIAIAVALAGVTFAVQRHPRA